MSDLEPITRSEQYMSAISGEYDGNIPPPVTRTEKIMKAIYDRLGNMNGGGINAESVGQAMEAYVAENPEFWHSIPDGTITRAKLADGVPEQIRDETMQALSDEEITELLDNIL